MNSKLSLFFIFFRLGLTSFGGPVAHLGYFRDEFVSRRGWFSEQQYADNVALCQLIPGPASSQVGLLIGYQRAGYLGALLAWLGFTLPSAAALGYLGVSLANPSTTLPPLLLLLLKVIAIAVVLQAVIGMARNFCKTPTNLLLMIGCAIILSLAASPWLTPILILIAGTISVTLDSARHSIRKLSVQLSLPSILWLAVFTGGLLTLPVLASSGSQLIQLLDGFFRAGALVFGGGHVVLPLLADATVARDLISSDIFMSGYGAAQAVPGPLFTFAAFLGGALNGDVSTAVLATLAIFLPAVALLFGVLPIWEQIKEHNTIRVAIGGANAAVVGVLLSALIGISLETITSIYLATGVVAVYGLIEKVKIPAWMLVLAATLLSMGASVI